MFLKVAVSANRESRRCCVVASVYGGSESFQQPSIKIGVNTYVVTAAFCVQKLSTNSPFYNQSASDVKRTYEIRS